MFLYTVLEAIVGIIAGLLIAIRTKKSANIVYGKLDKAGRITNVLLIFAYVCFSPFYLFLGMICTPHYNGFLGIVGWGVSIIAASAALFCGLGIGASVALRKKGKSRLSFAAQFAGVAGIMITLLIFLAFYGNLLSPLN